MLPSAFPLGSSKGGDQLFAQYKRTLKKKENAQAQREKAEQQTSAAASRMQSGVHSTSTSGASSVFNSPNKQLRPGTDAEGFAQTPGAMSPATAYSMPPGMGVMSSPPASSPMHWPRGSPGSVFDSAEAQFPASSSSSSSVPATPGGTISARRTPGATPNGVAPRKRLAPEEINAKWKEIFGVMELWTSEDAEPQTPTTASVKGSATTSAATYRVTSYASAAAAQAQYATELARYEQLAEGYAFRAQQHAALVLRAQQQQRNGLHKGERRIILSALEPPPSAPQLPPLTPFTPSIAAVDAAWRAELRREPEKLRGDAMDHKALEGRLMDFLHRESHPLTLIKEAFVANFLEAYSVAKNPTLRACTTNQASDLLLSNTLPTLLYFLDLLTKLLMKLFPELDATRNPETLESIRQSAMESIFPSIFPTLFALYKRKYFFRDAELASKMSVLSSVGPGGCNFTLLDLGVSKWFCLDDQVVMREREKVREKKRMRERRRRREEDGETEAEADLRETEEDRVREKKEAAALKKILEERKKAKEEEQLGLRASDPSTGGGHPISQLTHAFDQAALDGAGAGEEANAAAEDGEAGMRTPPRRVGASQTTLSPITSPSQHTRSSSATPTPTLLRSPSASSRGGVGMNGRPVSAGSPGSAAMPILPPVTRLSPVTGFNSSSLSRSPRAEKIADAMLSRSPSRRIAGSLATAPLPSPSNISKSQRKIGLVPSTAVSINADDSLSSSSVRLLDHSPARSKSLRMLSASQIAAANAALRNGGEITGEGTDSTTSTAAPTDLLVHPPSPRSNLSPADSSHSGEVAKKQVGFFSPGATETTTAGEGNSPTLVGKAADAAPASISSTTSTVTAQPSSLGLALQQRRVPAATAAATSSALHPSSHSANSSASGPTTPPRVLRDDGAPHANASGRKKPGSRALGLGLGGRKDAGQAESEEDEDEEDGLSSKRHPWQGDRDREDDSSNDNSPRMPPMANSTSGNGGFPALGSSMPMLQGLPSSMLTHTPGSGSELLKREIARQREGKRGMRKGAGENDVQGSPQLPTSDSNSSHHSTSIPPANHLSAQQPFILNSSPAGLGMTSGATDGAHGDGHAREDGTEETNDDDDDDDDEDGPAFPYQEAVILLRQLTSERTPRDKLQCLIAVSQEVCWCVDRFYSRPIFMATGFRPKPEELCINADDLLSIVSFILLKSQLPNVISEAAFIDDFISRAMKLHLPGYFLATFQASIELITKLDRQKFLTREMLEKELKDGGSGGGGGGGGQPNGSPNAGGGANSNAREKQRRPSYLGSNAGINGALSSSLPRASSQAIDATSTLPHGGGALPPGVVSAGSQPRPGVGIRHVQPVLLNPGQTIAQRPSSSRASGTTTAVANGAPSASTNSGMPQSPPPQLRVNVAATPSSGSVTPPRAAFTSGGGVPKGTPSSTNVSPASASSRATTSATSSHAHSSSVDPSSTRSQSFHSSPGLRLEDASSMEGSVASSSWSQPFTVVAEHFSHPNTPVRANRRASGNANTITTLQQAIGQMRGM